MGYLYDIKILCCAGIGIACGVIDGGVSNFASSWIKGFGSSGIYATLLQLPTGAIEVIIVPLCGLVATYVPNSCCIVLAVVSLIPFAGLLGIRFTSLDRHGRSLDVPGSNMSLMLWSLCHGIYCPPTWQVTPSMQSPTVFGSHYSLREMLLVRISFSHEKLHATTPH